VSDLSWSAAAGFLLAAVIAAAAWRLRALNTSGAAAAALLGTIIFGLGGLGWAILLVAFFVSSSGLSRLAGRRKSALEEKFSKGSQRDAAQVAANGGIAGIFALLHALFPAALWPWLGFAGALAAANADTWATELGVLSHSPPRLITSGRQVERGESGGITLAGTMAAAVGALFIALLAVIFWQGQLPGLALPFWLRGIPSPELPGSSMLQLSGALIALTIAGLLGSLLDSLLGATVQAIYRCSHCGKATERFPLHSCGGATARIRGWAWMNNDWVNIFCTLAGALIAVLTG
jgi:uncharacterized protein (TIGR00297 family)